MTALANLQAPTRTTPPDWILAFFEGIDEKHFEPPFCDFLTEDAHLRFGVHDVRGRAAIIATLKKFDTGMDTLHRVLEYWDFGPIKFLRGEVTMTKHDNSPPQTPAFVHCWYLAEGETDKVSELYGAVGPMAE